MRSTPRPGSTLHRERRRRCGYARSILRPISATTTRISCSLRSRSVPDAQRVDGGRVGAGRRRSGKCRPTGDADVELSVDELMQPYAGAARARRARASRRCACVSTGPTDMANLEERTPATPVTNYRLASVTKQFTAAADPASCGGRTDCGLDDPVRRWLPSLPPAADARDGAPPPHAHLRAHRLRRCHSRNGDERSFATRMSSRSSKSQDRTYFAPGERLSLQQQRLRAARADRRASVRQIIRNVPARAHLPAARHE